MSATSSKETTSPDESFSPETAFAGSNLVVDELLVVWTWWGRGSSVISSAVRGVPGFWRQRLPVVEYRFARRARFGYPAEGVPGEDVLFVVSSRCSEPGGRGSERACWS